MRSEWHMKQVYRRLLKRSFDVMMASVLLVLVAPVLVTLASVVWIFHGSPILFLQERSGKDGREFRIAKFRSMRSENGPNGKPLTDELRLTRFGKWLRATSLDELPTLWNVFIGKMSLVGPRPLLPEYLSRYSPEQARRHDVKPGITGWAQVNGRNSIGWEEKFELDVWYVDHQSFWLDLRILWMTVLKVLSRSGVSANGHATMPEFQGSTAEDRRAA